jgi:glycosyltransferase involved in cell wall biosynthesis
MPFFSIVIPVFNRASALKHAIESVRAQTFQDFEIVVVDDGSTDDPKAVVENFADPRIRYFRQPNGGGGAARNRGIDEAEGLFVAFLDSDDVFLPHHLASMHALLQDTNRIVGYARVRVDRGDGRVFLKPPRAKQPDEDMASYLLCDRGFTPTITMTLPREAAARIRFHEKLRAAEDTDFAIRLTHAGYRFRMLEEPGAVWNDGFDPNRQSSGRNSGWDAEELDSWLDAMRPIISPRAYHGGRGWAYAKQIVQKRPLAALGLYLNAVARGCYRPSLAVVIFLQIFLGPTAYRRLADYSIAWLKAGLREPEKKAPLRKLERA